MRIVQVPIGSARMPPKEGGAPLQVIFHTSKHLAKMGHDVVILDSRYSPEDAAVEYIDELKIVRLSFRKVPVLKSSRMPRYLRFALNELNTVLFALKVSRYLTKNSQNIDVIHLHATSVGLVLSLLNRKLRDKMFYTSHLGQWVLRGTRRLTILERIHVFLDSYLIRRVAKVVALNDLAKESFITIGRVNPKKVIVVYNGVDTEFFKPTLGVEEIRKKYDLEGKFTVLFVGQLSKIKGVEYLVKAADIIINELGHKDTLFLLVGPLTFGTLEKPIDMEAMLGYIRQHQLERNIIFAGALPLEEVKKLYVASDIFVLPSLAEGDPLVVVEAMASGKPIIGTKVGGIPHKVSNAWNGFLIDPADERQLADKIKYLIDHPEERKRMGANSRQYAEEEFDWRKVAERLSLVYQSKWEHNPLTSEPE
jgi:glycosyltransferase involved in cell wall biosynthesis